MSIPKGETSQALMKGESPGWNVNSDPPSSDGTSSSIDSPKGKIMKRETWSRKIDFLLACIGFSVGLGNVWRFPFLCYRNGGGAFLIPYFIAVVLGGIPVFFLEVSLGQFMSEGGIGPWKICPLFQGIGYASAVIVFLLNCDYNIILTWAFYYLFSSFTSVLPWSHCDNDWNSPNCTTFRRKPTENITLGNSTFTHDPQSNSTSMNTSFVNSTVTYVVNVLTNASDKQPPLMDPVTEFWESCISRLPVLTS